ncbi:MAG: hypothetical protein CNA95_00125 [Pelagibacterales bacterium MED-G41]|nr:MAG: hypothetical protein CNA95_00125 [Pelagibacterales bacterium MED-G41]
MKIGIYFETLQNTGGAHHQNIRLLELFKKNLPNSYEINYIVSNEEQKGIIEEKGSKAVLFKKNLIFRIESFILKLPFFKEIYKKFSLINRFEKFLLSQKFDLLFFNAPYEISLLVGKINFIVMLLSMQHRTHGFFPEYQKGHDNDLRDSIIDNAVKKSFKIFVGAEKDKNLLVKFFNADENKIIVQSYSFTLPNLYEKNLDYDYEKTYNNLKLPLEKKIFIYPAQFWAHKNHKYIIDVCLNLKKDKKSNIHFVFCGHDNGNLKYVKRLIKENNLEEHISIFHYLSDFQLISLYLNCYGVLMPSYIGHTTIPMYEAFFFKKNIFYTKGLSDNSVKNHLTEIDIDNIESFLDNLKIIENDKETNEIKLNAAKLFYDKHCDEKKVMSNFEKVFKEYKKIRDLWD